jgi:hypothetical protein
MAHQGHGWKTSLLANVPQEREPGAGVPGAEVLVLAPARSHCYCPQMGARKESRDGLLTVANS